VELTNTEAVWLLAHLVGDVHQPLHVGQVYFDNTCKRRINPNDSNEEYLTTAGGNFIALEQAVGGIRNLHLYWDVVAGANAMRREGVAEDEAAFAKKLAAIVPAGWETSGDAETWPQQWVAEIMPLAGRAYRPDINGEVRPGPPPFPSRTVSCKSGIALDQAYHDEAGEVAGKQLHKAGYRLAAILKAALRQP
jgi:S1/P1 Nuclease